MAKFWASEPDGDGLDDDAGSPAAGVRQPLPRRVKVVAAVLAAWFVVSVVTTVWQWASKDF